MITIHGTIKSRLTGVEDMRFRRWFSTFYLQFVFGSGLKAISALEDNPVKRLYRDDELILFSERMKELVLENQTFIAHCL